MDSEKIVLEKIENFSSFFYFSKDDFWSFLKLKKFVKNDYMKEKRVKNKKKKDFGAQKSVNPHFS